jgi:hypothetical protein
MMPARSCQLWITVFLSAAEFWLDIANRCYYAISCFLQRAEWKAGNRDYSS